jgi:hypothetical protein
MRRYDDPVEVRRGAGVGPGGPTDLEEGPEQFLWHGRLWKVRAVLAHWVETGPWWQSQDARAVVGTDEPGATAPVAGGPRGTGLLAERELWRVEAGRGADDAGGVFELSFSWDDGSWLLVGCAD